jgi:hypothetical protein
MRNEETIDSELRFVALLRLVSRAQGGPPVSISVVDALLDERREATQRLLSAESSLAAQHLSAPAGAHD